MLGTTAMKTWPKAVVLGTSNYSPEQHLPASSSWSSPLGTWLFAFLCIVLCELFALTGPSPFGP